ncbi:nitroreductase family deazaflavin-dependent oxidoreductase [Nocardia sp. XZ_19_231]|uniref:nitroreductase family deazaflavin-dependent oxidoreductase n=1 Tax=Nocardia sp. XZ_19_231 TaxID=2769252 RepID=UPI00189087EA|nr:nitroreductase family deazaflavin-dependent oxidoreductase [Nocardia sp. XZ_19_231]
MPTDLQLKITNRVHRALLTVSGGRLGNSFFGMPSLQLTTIGRKSGDPRKVMLTAPIIDGDMIVIVASRAGDPTHPAWFLNLRDNPNVEVSLRNGPERPMTARVATPDERATLWPRVTSSYKGYADYQTKTTREIPLVLLTPRS